MTVPAASGAIVMTGRGSLAGRPRFEALPAVTHERTTRSPISRSRLLESVEASPHTDRCCPSPLSRGNAMIQRSRAGHRTPHRRCRSIMWIFPTDPVDNAYRANAAVAALPGRAVAALRVGGPSRAWLLDDRLRSGGVVGAVAVGGGVVAKLPRLVTRYATCSRSADGGDGVDVRAFGDGDTHGGGRGLRAAASALQVES